MTPALYIPPPRRRFPPLSDVLAAGATVFLMAVIVVGIVAVAP